VYVTPKSPKGWHKNATSLFVPVLSSTDVLRDRLSYASGLAKRSASVAGELRKLPILPAKTQWVGSVSMNDDGCER